MTIQNQKKKATKSVLNAKSHEKVLGFAIYLMTFLFYNDILEKLVFLYICTDSRSFYYCFVRLNCTTKSELVIDICTMQEYYERKEISEAFCILSQQNPVYELTKLASSKAL